jgi:hypothetical protein
MSDIISLNVNKTLFPPGFASPALEGRYLVDQSGLFSRWLAKMRWVSLDRQVLVIHRGTDKVGKFIIFSFLCCRVARCAEPASGCAEERGEEPEGRVGGRVCRCRWAGACACMRMIMDAYAPTLASELL